MFQHNFRRGVQLHRMLTKCPKIRNSVMSLIKRVITLIHSEQYNPKTVEFMALSPAGEPGKIMLVLETAEYSTAPIVEPEMQPSDPSYKMTSFVDSLYKAIVGYNGAMEGFFMCSPGLATVIYSVCNYIYERWFKNNQCDIPASIVWDTYDWWITKDLLITGIISE